MFPLSVQFYMFMVNVALGLTLAFVFDACRAVRSVLAGRRPGRRQWLVDLSDLLFWALAVPAVVVAWGWGNWGQVRAFTFLGLAAGVAVYAGLGAPTLYPAMVGTLRATGRGVVRSARWSRRAVRRTASGCLHAGRGVLRGTGWILRPLVWPLRWLARPLESPTRPLRDCLARRRQRWRVRWEEWRQRLAALWRPAGPAPPHAPD